MKEVLNRNVVTLTQAGDPVVDSTTIKRENPGALRLGYAIKWFNRASRIIPIADRKKARLSLPISSRWLVGWLPKAQRVEFEAKETLLWTDWNNVMGDVKGKFERDLKQ